MATNTNPFYTYSATAGSSKTLQKPQDGGDNNQWGNYINTDLDEIVAAVNALSDKIADANENTLVDFTATGSAVNHVGITNAATGNPPQISSAGSDTNVDLTLTAQGTGDINLTPGTNGDVNIPASKGITFGDDGEKIEGDGTDLTLTSGADINLTATADVNLPNNVGLVFGNDGEKIEGDGTDLTIASSGEININSGTLDLSAQTVDVTLNNAVDALNFDSNTLSIDASNNRIGIGVSDPDVELEIKKSSANVTLAINAATAANDAQLKFRTGDADDFTIYVDGSATNDPLHFYDHASSTNMMTLVNGNVGIGTTNPQSDLSIVDPTTNSGIEIQPEVTTDTNRITNYDRVANAYKKFRLDAEETEFYISGTERMLINSSGRFFLYTGNGSTSNYSASININQTNNLSYQRFIECVRNDNNLLGGIRRNDSANSLHFYSGSDRRIKTNIQDFVTPCLDKINQLRLVTYDLKGGGGSGLSIIAQELVEIFPNKVEQTDDGTGEDLPEGVQEWTISNDFTFELIKAIQELSAKVTALENATN